MNLYKNFVFKQDSNNFMNQLPTVDKILKTIPLITLLILICSLVKNYIYYEYFGININEFISLSEFSLLFISEIKLYLIFIISLIIFLPFIFLKNFAQKNFGEKIFSFSLTKSFSIIFILVFPLRILRTIFTENDLLIIIEKCQQDLIFLFVTILLVINNDIKVIRKLYLFFCTISLIIFSITKAYVDIEKIKRNLTNYEVEFNYENYHVKTEKDYIYVGKTHEYIFIFNNSKKQTEIYKTGEIKNLKIKKTEVNRGYK